MSLTAHSDPASVTKRYGMTVDVNRCVGCQTCTIACKHANDTTPDVQWRSVLDVEQGEYPDVQRFFLVVGCQHCAEPPCVPVCPTGATAQRADGLVTMDHDLCIGCAYCAVACPYQARTIVHEDTHYFSKKTKQEEHTNHPERFGTVQKCTFCIDRVDEAEAAGLTPGEDHSVTPACAASCIAQAITFGDFNNPDSNVAKLVRDRNSFQINDFLDTDPQIKYLYDVPGAIPGQASDTPTAGQAQAVERDPTSPLNGELQTFWDFRAAMNFIMGGAGSGLIVMAALAALDGHLDAEKAAALFATGGTVIAIGLFFVLMKIGRKERFFYAILRPQTSWMSREVWIVAALFPLIGASFIWPSPQIWLATGFTGLAFLYCQAQILFAAKGIPAWRAPLIPVMIVISGLTEGAGIALVALSVLGQSPSPNALAVMAVVLAPISAVLWLAYVARSEANGIPLKARDVLKSAKELVAIGWIIAAVVLGICLLLQPASLFFALGGLIALATGALWKEIVIVQASYQQGFVLPKVPGRGSGQLAAPPRLGGHARAA